MNKTQDTRPKTQGDGRNKRVIVALDTPDLDALKKLTDQLKGVIHYYKVGFELFTAHSWKAVDMVRETGAEIFLDLKLHDIPNTVSKAAAVIVRKQVSMFNVHALGGLEMMKRTRAVVDETVSDPAKRPKILAVTILTSHNEDTLSDELNISKSVQGQVVSLAKLAHQAGLDGVVCSPQEIELIRKELPKDFLIVTPGIRLDKVPGSFLQKEPGTSEEDDQKRTLDPKQAFDLGASHIVIGRPITASEDPLKAAQAILQSL